MGLLDFLSSREKKVSNEKLEANISKLCEELTTGIIQLSDKAKQLNELKDKYNQMQSQVQTTTTGASSETSPPKPVKEKSLFSTLFGSSQDDTPPASPTAQQAPDDNDQPAEDNFNPDMLSAASTASPESLEQQQAQSSPIDQPLKDVSQADIPQEPQPSPPPPPPLDYNNISSSPFGSDAMQPVPAPAATPDAAAAPSPEEALQNPTIPLVQPPPPPQPQPPIAQDPDKSAITIGGKNRKKSKRSKKTIRKSDKTLNKVTKKQKIINTDSSESGESKAKAQGLAQALLQSQGQS
jgi:hypothetical protein